MSADPSPALEEILVWLFVPGNRPDRFAKAAASGADGVIFDLEDAVAAADKASARASVVSCLTSADASVPLGVRVNAPRTREQHADLQALLGGAAPYAVFVPKTESASDVRTVKASLAAMEADVLVVALIESAQGVLDIAGILDATPDALLIGEADLSADLGCELGAPLLRTAVDVVLLHAAARRTPVIASPSFTVHDLEEVAEDAASSRRDGCIAKAAIHPAQVPVIRDAFLPSSTEVHEAQDMLAVDGVGMSGGRMVDEATLRHARRVLTRKRSAERGHR